MEYQYSDIEAQIRRAEKMRSEALGEILSVGFHKFVQFFNGLAHRRLHKHIVAARSSAAVIY